MCYGIDGDRDGTCGLRCEDIRDLEAEVDKYAGSSYHYRNLAVDLATGFNNVLVRLEEMRADKQLTQEEICDILGVDF